MFKVKITGLAGLKAEFASISQQLPNIVSGELETMAQRWVELAKKDAPADQGMLRQAITYYQVSDLRYEIVAQKFYAPFMEFGTKGKYRPIPGTEAIAAQFKGYKGGDFEEMVRMLGYWIRRQNRNQIGKGKKRPRKTPIYDSDLRLRQAAFGLAIYILKVGVNPHPYFFKQREIVWPEMVRNVERRLAQVTKVKVQMPSDVRKPRITTI